jgi:hypothetical protein
MAQRPPSRHVSLKRDAAITHEILEIRNAFRRSYGYSPDTLYLGRRDAAELAALLPPARIERVNGMRVVMLESTVHISADRTRRPRARRCRHPLGATI